MEEIDDIGTNYIDIVLEETVLTILEKLVAKKDILQEDSQIGPNCGKKLK